MIKNPARSTTEYVVKNAKSVKINREKLQSLAFRLAKKENEVPDWTFEFHLDSRDEKALLDYMILLDTVNFCFWSKKSSRWEFEHNGKKWNGYFAMALALKVFFEENPEKGSLEYWKNMEFVEFKEILQGGKNLLFLKERWQNVKKVSSYILKKYGSSMDFIKKGNHKFSELVPLVAKLPSFGDIHTYHGKRIHILKRAQILCGDIMGEFANKGIGNFKDPEYLTAFADYKIPQILQSWGVLEYSKSLALKIEKGKLIKSGSEEEIEIRSCTIWAVEMLAEELKRREAEILPYQIDWMLWNESQNVPLCFPYHRTPTIFY